MKTRSLLLYVPGTPLDVSVLLPQRRLAALASCLLQEGHETQILDWGTAEGLSRLGTPGLRAAASLAWCGAAPSAKSWLSWLGIRERSPLERLAEESLAQRREEVLSSILAHTRLDFVVFQLESRADALAVRPIVEQMAERCPQVRRIAVGAYPETFGTAMLAESNVFHGACVGDIETSIIALAERITRPERWNAVPNLLYAEAGRVSRTPRDLNSELDAFPRPAYDADTYPAMRGNEKFKVFSLEHSRGRHHVDFSCAEVPWSGRQVRVRSIESLGTEIGHWTRTHGARVFHFSGDATPSAQVERFCAEMLANHSGVAFSREGHLAYCAPETFRALASAGCLSMDFRLDTGSQRLLEDFYGHNYGVTRAEEVLRGCMAAGVFASVRLTYPCPLDDRHTVAETLRILSRTRPDAATIAAPAVPPGSAWRNRAEEFGFQISGKPYVKWAGAEERAISWGLDAPESVPYRMRGWNPARIQEARTELDAGIRELKIRLHASSTLGLLARLESGRNETEYMDALSRALYACDANALSAFAASFNAQAMVPANTIPFRSFVPVRAVVGN